MKKYLQITLLLGIFFLFVIFRRINNGTEATPVITSNQVATPTTVPTSDILNGDTPIPTLTVPAGSYKDGTYTGSVEDAFYGNYQVQVNISGGRISDIAFLQYPNDNSTSTSINNQAMSLLKSEAIQTQSANVDIVSGASDSSMAFQKSLATALQQAKA